MEPTQISAVPVMDAGMFANSVSFRLYGTESRCWQYTRLQARLGRLGVSLEVLNTRLPENARGIRRRLGPLLPMTRMSTYAVGAVINHGVSQMPAGTVYLNIGVWKGFSFFAGLAGNADRRSIGVDDFSQFDGPRAEFLAAFERLRGPNDSFAEADFRDYLTRLHDGSKVGFYFYDGPHEYQDQLDALELVEPYLVPGSVILVDDTDQDAPRRATMDFLASRSDRYALVADRSSRVGATSRDAHPTFWHGIMLVERRA